MQLLQTFGDFYLVTLSATRAQLGVIFERHIEFFY